MFRDGPIPAFVHGLVEYGAGVAFLVAPFVLDWDKPSATLVSIIVGISILVVAIFFLALGALHLLLTFATQFREREQQE